MPAPPNQRSLLVYASRKMNMLSEQRHKESFVFGSDNGKVAWLWRGSAKIVAPVIVAVHLLPFLLPVTPTFQHENLSSFLVNMFAVVVCCQALSHWKPAKMLALCAVSAAVSQTLGVLFLERMIVSSYPVVLGLLAATVSVQCCLDKSTPNAASEPAREGSLLLPLAAPQVAVILLAVSNLLIGTNNGLSLWNVLPALVVGAVFALWSRLVRVPAVACLVYRRS